MTANLVAYWRHKEDSRHNVVVERQQADQIRESRRHNLVAEAQAADNLVFSYAQLGEQRRHNLASEQVSLMNVQELNRHNRATEAISINANAEIARHNVSSEQELTRHNVSSEQELTRHNQELETLESRRVFTQQRRQDLDEQKFELEKTQYVTDTVLGAGNWLTNAARTVAGLFGSKGK